MPQPPSSTVLIVMGVSGSGKTTVAKELAVRQGWAFYDADDYHSPASVAKMRRSEGLTDADRAPWLKRLRALIEEETAASENAVLACSALKKRYRQTLGGEGVRFVYLDADRALIRERLSGRDGHYAKTGLLKSQFEALEEPSPDEALIVSADQPLDAIVREIEAALTAA